ncbi:MAG TPA: DEAD/DEAH box helicase [Tissierellia bacterium]|nr:DEAD/DEAH box helicase [Tissierellia bacterium]
MNFNELTSNSAILQAIEDKGYTEATDIQARVIPIIRDGKDLIGQSQTGTGKTAAFAIPTIEKIDPELKKPQVLILCPTRELAVQVAGEYQELAKHTPITALAVYGGDPIQKQIGLLKRGPQVVVGTPGRMMDHLRRKTIQFDYLHTIILDEADEMLNMGFREDIETILQDVSTKTQRLLFSATMPKAILDITHEYLIDPARVQIEPTSITTDTVKQQYVAVQKRYKQDVLYRLLDAKQPRRCLIFCNTKKMVDDIIVGLQDRGYIAERIHGDMKQEMRIATLRQFNRGSIQILVATDVAARGLDIEEVDLVINYDMPQSDEYYVHRIGRSGRAGRIGESITILTYKEHSKLKELERFIDKKVEQIQVPSLKRLNEIKVDNFIEDIVQKVEDEDYSEYQPVIDRLKDSGAPLELVVAALLKDSLQLHDQMAEQDLNDHTFGKPRGSFRDRKKTPGNRQRQADARKKGYDKRKRNTGGPKKKDFRDTPFWKKQAKKKSK